MKKTVVFDFDGVIHSYKSGWKGVDIIPDPPVRGIKDALKRIHDAGYEVVVVSTRCADFLGKFAIEQWLDYWEISAYVDKICKEKPPAICYIDDRAICFDGCPELLFDKINEFKPWNAEGDTKEKEAVNHPSHYNLPGRKECIDEMVDEWGEDNVAMWCEITAYKYEYRAGFKDGNSKQKDLKKRRWYLNKAAELRDRNPRAEKHCTALGADSAAQVAYTQPTVEITDKNANDAAEQIRKDIAKAMYGDLGLNYGA